MTPMTCVSLGDAVELINGDRGKNYPDREAQRPSGYCLFLNTKNVRRGQFDFSEVAFIDEKRHAVLGGGSLKRNDIVLTIRGTLGNTAVFREGIPYDVVRINSAMLALRPNPNFDPDFIEHFLRSNMFLDWVSANQRGSAQPHLRTADIETAQLPLFSKKHQQKLVRKIDNLSAKSRRASDRLDHIPRLVEKYKQAVLAAAFRGELTRSWRTSHGRQFVYPITLISELADVVTGFTPPTKHRSRYFGGNVAFFKPTDLNAGYQVVEPRETLTEEGALVGRKLPKYSTLVTCIGATIGKTGFARVECCTNQQINGLVPHSDLVVPEWLYWMVISEDFQQSIFDNASATTLPIINKGRFLSLSLLRPPLEEQREIVRRIEIAFGWIERLASEATNARKLIDNLDDAILAKAFWGELVPQDPSDEPASALLERIRADREARSSAKRR